MPGQAPDTAMRTGTGKVIPGHNHVSTDTIAQVAMLHIEAITDHDIGIIATTPEVAHNVPVPLQLICTQKLIIIPLQRSKPVMITPIPQIVKMRFT